MKDFAPKISSNRKKSKKNKAIFRTKNRSKPVFAKKIIISLLVTSLLTIFTSFYLFDTNLEIFEPSPLSENRVSITFPESLKEETVLVEIEEVLDKSDCLFLLQVEAYGKEEFASEMLYKLTSMDLNPFIEEIDEAGLSRLAVLENIEEEHASTASLDISYLLGNIETSMTLFSSRIEHVTELETTSGIYNADNMQQDIDKQVRLVNAAGAHAWHIAKMAGLNLPVFPVRHEYFISSAIENVNPNLPTMRIPEASLYLRASNNSLLLGGWEPDCVYTDPKNFKNGEKPPMIKDDLNVMKWFKDQLKVICPKNNSIL